MPLSPPLSLGDAVCVSEMMRKRVLTLLFRASMTAVETSVFLPRCCYYMRAKFGRLDLDGGVKAWGRLLAPRARLRRKVERTKLRSHPE